MCPAGYYCPKGTTTAPVCGDASLYCPEGSTVPTTADPGYYTAGGTSVSTRTHQIECQFGHYCIDGIKTACPAGRYGQTRRISSETCTGPCPAGYVCPAGSVALGADDKITDCGSSAVYCPSGSGSPVLVSTGYYTSGGDSPTRHITQTECEPGCAALVVVVCCMQVAERLTPPRMCPPPGTTVSLARSFHAAAACMVPQLGCRRRPALGLAPQGDLVRRQGRRMISARVHARPATGAQKAAPVAHKRRVLPAVTRWQGRPQRAGTYKHARTVCHTAWRCLLTFLDGCSAQVCAHVGSTAKSRPQKWR